MAHSDSLKYDRLQMSSIKKKHSKSQQKYINNIFSKKSFSIFDSLTHLLITLHKALETKIDSTSSRILLSTLLNCTWIVIDYCFKSKIETIVMYDSNFKDFDSFCILSLSHAPFINNTLLIFQLEKKNVQCLLQPPNYQNTYSYLNCSKFVTA